MVALLAATAMLKGEMVIGAQGGREMFLPLDGLIGITVSYRGRRITIPVDAIMDAIGGK